MNAAAALVEHWRGSLDGLEEASQHEAAMSDDNTPARVKVIEKPITGEVWWIAALVAHFLPTRSYSTLEGGDMWEAMEHPEYDAPWDEQTDLRLWNVTVRGDNDSSIIRVTAPAEQEHAWIERLEQIDEIAAYARERRQHTEKVTGEDVIERYYLIKRIGGKITIKQLAEQYGFNETYLYQVKSAFDKAGKLGKNAKQAYKVSE